MNIWYYIFFATLVFFLIKSAISFFAGDVDVDFDADGDTDFDLSSMFSFKGVLHFLLGFSTYLSLISKLDTNYNGYGSYDYTIWNYLLAGIIGFIFMFILYQLYKFMMKLNHYNTVEDISFDNCKVSILSYNEEDNIYIGLVYTPSGTYKKDIYNETGDKLNIGKEYNIVCEDNKLIVKNA